MVELEACGLYTLLVVSGLFIRISLLSLVLAAGEVCEALRLESAGVCCELSIRFHIRLRPSLLKWRPVLSSFSKYLLITPPCKVVSRAQVLIDRAVWLCLWVWSLHMYICDLGNSFSREPIASATLSIMSVSLFWLSLPWMISFVPRWTTILSGVSLPPDFVSAFFSIPFIFCSVFPLSAMIMLCWFPFTDFMFEAPSTSVLSFSVLSTRPILLGLLVGWLSASALVEHLANCVGVSVLILVAVLSLHSPFQCDVKLTTGMGKPKSALVTGTFSVTLLGESGSLLVVPLLALFFTSGVSSSLFEALFSSCLPSLMSCQ